MRRLVKISLILALLGAIGAAGYTQARRYWKQRNRPKWRTAEVARGRITSVVNATGDVKPVLSVQVGSFVSGPILELHVNFNEEVKKGQLLAKIDPRIYEASVQRDRAAMASREADVQRVKALLQQAENDHKRAELLKQQNGDFISDSAMDRLKFTHLSLVAELSMAQASVDQARANLDNSLANLEYTNIVSPVDGIVIDRKIDPGQTLAAQFQTPQLFTVAPDMRKKTHVHALVDEADIGLIRAAQVKGQPVHFTVDAYPDDLFEGKIEEVRYSSTSTQNVVTYPVVVAAPNPDLKLLPGMTASISFQVEEREDVLKIPNAALRYYPNPDHVRSEDRKLLEGTETSEPEDQEADISLSAAERAEARRKRTRRHVWVADGEFLKAVEVVTGLSDNRYTELVSGDINLGQNLVTGIEPKKLF